MRGIPVGAAPHAVNARRAAAHRTPCRKPAAVWYDTGYMESIILTGIKPTGEIHLGNYFGTIKQMIDLQRDGTMFMFLADLHALTD